MSKDKYIEFSTEDIEKLKDLTQIIIQEIMKGVCNA